MRIRSSMTKLVLIYLCCSCIKINAQSVEAPYEVGTWKNFCSAAVTYTFDDQCANQFAVAAPMFDKLGFKATFYPVINWGPDWAKLQPLGANGHEIGSHSMSHPQNLASMDNTTEDGELKNSQSEINKQIPGKQCITIAYPNCNSADTMLLRKYFIGGRKCQGQVESKTPADFWGISSIMCGANAATNGMNSAEGLKSKCDAAANSNGWCVFLVHGVDDDGGYSSLSSSIIQTNLDYLNTNKSKFWVSTFVNVIKYIKERNAVKIDETITSTDSLVLQITDNLPDSIYNIPITIRRLLPTGWTTAVASQKGKVLTSSITTVNAKSYIMFGAAPDSGNIIIKKAATSTIDKMQQSKRNDLNVKITKSTLVIKIGTVPGSNINVTLHNLNGVIMSKHNLTRNEYRNRAICLPLTGLENTVYMVRVSDGNRTWSEKIVNLSSMKKK